jgi:hypothetical protein
MASTTNAYMTTMLNCINDLKRETLNELLKALESKNLLTEEINEILSSMVSTVKTNKKVKKETKPRFSGYHLFMKEHRAVVKTEQPGIKPQELTSVVAKAWKEQTNEVKNDFNTRASKMKDEYNNSFNDNESSDNEKPEKNESDDEKDTNSEIDL